MGKEGEVWGDKSRIEESKGSLTHDCMFPSTGRSDPSCCIIMAKLYNVDVTMDFEQSVLSSEAGPS